MTTEGKKAAAALDRYTAAALRRVRECRSNNEVFAVWRNVSADFNEFVRCVSDVARIVEGINIDPNITLYEQR